MAFKMNKPSITQGTVGHKSAAETHLKMSALKAKEDKESSDMMLDYSYTPDPKAKSYGQAYHGNLDYKYPSTKPEKEGHWAGSDTDHTKVDKYGREYKGDTTLPKHSIEGERSRQKEFETAAKAWNMKTYGTHNPTADAKKAGINKEELAKQHSGKTSDSSSTSTTKTEPVKNTSKIETKDGTITNTDVKGGGTKATIESNSKPLNSSGGRGKVVNKDRPMTREEETAQRKRREDKEAAESEKETGTSKAPKSESKPTFPGKEYLKGVDKLNMPQFSRIVTKTKSHTGATTKTVDRGGKVRRVVSKDAQGNKSVVKYDRKGNVKKTGKQKRAEKEAKKDAERAEKKATYNTKKAEMNAKNARVKAEKIAKNNAEGDAKKANMNKAADALEKDVADSAMKKHKTKY